MTVSAAISMKDALTAAAGSFEKASGDHVSFNFLASGPLMKQIEEGAPVDVFISAAREQMDELQQKNLIDPATRQDVAGGELVVIMPAGSAVAPPTTLNDLADGKYRRIAIGEPKSVPAGHYAMESLKTLKIDTAVADKLQTAINVRQVLDYVVRGEVDAGFVYRTDAVQAGDQVKVAFTVPARLHEPIEYPAAVVKRSKSPAEARKFIDYLRSTEGRDLLTKFGFAMPTASTATPDGTPTAPTTQASHG